MGCEREMLVEHPPGILNDACDPHPLEHASLHVT